MRTYTDGAAVDGCEPSIVLAGRRVHMIGIGGAGMSGAAALLQRLGARVDGSDLAPFPGMGNLVSGGARIAIGHRAEQLADDASLVVYSAAVPDSNPELVAARARQLCVIKYAELVGAIMRRYRKGVAIAGTHGKSTTTALTAYLFREAGLAPSFLMGASSNQLGGNSGVGDGPHFIVEACEFNRSFHHFAPVSAAILNVEPDHLDCFRDLDDIVAAFAHFAGKVAARGVLVCNGEDPHALRAAQCADCAVETFGFTDGATWRAGNLQECCGCFAFDLFHNGRSVLSAELSIPGRHNVSNAVAAVALAHHAGADIAALAPSLKSFSGADRRMTLRGSGRLGGRWAGVTIVDDYAHHPTEIRVTIQAARSQYAPRRTWVIFQPHQYARTRHFMDAFAASLTAADEIIIPDIYGARESDRLMDAAGAEELVLRICKGGGHARYLPTLSSCADHVWQHASEGDLVMTMGAGDVWKVADDLVERIRKSD